MLVWALTGDWISALAIVVLWAIWRFLPKMEGPPVMKLALTFQWAQVTIAVLYCGITRRRIPQMDIDYHPAMLMGLGCLLALVLGLRLGSRMVPLLQADSIRRSILPVGWHGLALLYFAAAIVTGAVRELAWTYPGLTQAVYALTLIRLCVLFLVFRRLCHPFPRFGWIGAVLAIEVAVGFTGYFANFREPVLLAIVAVLEVFNRRKGSHWLAAGGLAVGAMFLGFLWLGIRTEYRKQFNADEAFANSRVVRAQRITQLADEWAGKGMAERLENLDLLVSRLWTVYYPSLAINRVPEFVPHENGNLMWASIQHVMSPRLFFPDKANMLSDSMLVRRFSGVWVHGDERATSIAFGYFAESYIDFGIPGMFIPILLFGMLVGAALRGVMRLIRCREAGIVLVTVLAWSSLYLFERSWTKMLGDTLTNLVFLGGAVLLVDRLFLAPPRSGRQPRAPIPQFAGPARGAE